MHVAKLSIDKVVRMRELFRAGASYDEAASMMGVSRTCAVNAIHGRTWSQVIGAVPLPAKSSTKRLRPETVQDIRRRYEEGRERLREIGDRYGLSAQAVSRIGRRRARTDVPDRPGAAASPRDRVPRGERSNFARLSSREVEVIRRLVTSLGTSHYPAIAEAFDTSRSNVSMIANGRRWRHLFDERRAS